MQKFKADLKQLEADVQGMPSDIQIENLSMLQYKESAEKFIKQSNDFAKRIQDYQTQIYTMRETIDNLQMSLQEMRAQIGDADLIHLTDNIFQRVQLRQIQKQIESLQKDYKHIFNKIEQEMEQNAENDYGSEGESNTEVAEEQFSNEQLNQDREFVTTQLANLKKQQQIKGQEIETLGNKLQ